MNDDKNDFFGIDQDLQQAIDVASQYFSDSDYGAALLLLKPLADAGVAQAIGLLGLAYRQGAGVEQDSEKAVELLLKAIEMGDAIAAYNLALLYQHGMPGVEINVSASKKYFEMAAEMGFQPE